MNEGNQKRHNSPMPVVPIRQLTDDDCLPCCIAMVLDRTREEVLSWFEDEEFRSTDVMIDVLAARGFQVDEFKSPEQARGTRRIVALMKGGKEGHAVVMDEDGSIADPSSDEATKKQLLDYAKLGLHVGRVFVIRKKD